MSHDGEPLFGARSTPRPDVRDPAFAVGHGFANTARRPVVAGVIGRSSRRGGVVAPDFRGSARSDRRAPTGADEVHGLAAEVWTAPGPGYRRVVTVERPTNAPVPIRRTAVAAVSGPAVRWARETPAVRRAANGHSEPWPEPGVRHAGTATTPHPVDRIATRLATASTPAAQEQGRR
ncbi:hypothetical protein [Umezawaea beigongshangensis]|uniref:hypothetical protein n=1 Tax=Umezawaea beigongshangensis TaxID=2780383 RepID=UPI0027DD1A8F|nr:hypothetical protein [Umezawaea beigongshangensis]